MQLWLGMLGITIKMQHPLKKLYSHISDRRRFQFKILLLVTILASFAEIVSLGSVVPFIAIVTQPENIFNYPLMSQLADYLEVTTPDNMVGPISILFVLAAIFAGLLRVLVLYFSIRLSNSTGADLSTEMYNRTLYQPYLVHISRSSSDIISGITQKVATATNVITAVVTVITNLFLFVAIFLTLLWIDPIIAGVAFAVFGSIYIAISVSAKKVLANNGVIVAAQQTNVVRSSQEGLGAIRDVLLEKSQEFYSKSYEFCVQRLQRALGTNQFITLAPRYVMEALALLMIGSFTFLVSGDSSLISSVMPTLGALALGAQRLLPVLQQLYGNFSLVLGSHQSLVDVVKLLEQKVEKSIPSNKKEVIKFNLDIKFKDLTFSYAADSPAVLKNLNLKIAKGSIVGFVGETGSGKSTAMDLVLGLLTPIHGSILVDDVEISKKNVALWQEKLAHVPQHIFLSDVTIAQNIAFGVPVADIDYKRVLVAATKAQLCGFVDSLPCGYETIVGERGANFSGGQRQRIGIARAFYKDASVLILDEATSALDDVTETLVMEALASSDQQTVIMIAHRIKTLANCDTIFQFSRNGGLKTTTYQELVS